MTVVYSGDPNLSVALSVSAETYWDLSIKRCVCAKQADDLSKKGSFSLKKAETNLVLYSHA